MDDISRQLHQAVLGGRIINVKKLLEQRCDINQTDQDGYTLLHMAVRYDKETVIKYLLSNGADVEKANPDGETSLHLAASLGRLKATKLILSHGANAEKEDKRGYSALYNAIENGCVDVVRYFINHGVEVNQGNTKGLTPLLLAAVCGKHDVVKYLIIKGADVNKGNEGMTALHSAALSGHLNVTQYLLSQGAEVHKESNSGAAALYYAAQGGHLDVTKYLISQGAEVNKRNNYGATALQQAVFDGHLDVTKYLISQGAEVNDVCDYGMNALHRAALNGHLDVTKYLINEGAEVNKGDNAGMTSLHFAAQSRHLDVTRYLISQGAEVNKGNNDGVTALHSAAVSGHLGITKNLISQGAEVNKGHNEGGTALHLAVQEGHLDLTKDFISQGAELNKGDDKGLTALHVSAQCGHLDITKYLINQGADSNKCDNGGNTALVHAACNGRAVVAMFLKGIGSHIELDRSISFTELHTSSERGDSDEVRALISQGAEVDRADTFGWTALHIASMNGHLHLVEYLLSQGAEINSSNSFGRTSLHSAAQNGHFDVLKCLIGRGAEVNKQNDVGWTALHNSIDGRSSEIIEYLINQGAHVNAVDVNGTTALHFAAQIGDLNTAKYLRSQGAEVNKRSESDSVILRFDTHYGHYEVAKGLPKLFLDTNNAPIEKLSMLKTAYENDPLAETKNAREQAGDVAHTTRSGMIALHSPYPLCDLDFREWILSKPRRTVGCTPLDFAVKRCKLTVARYLVSQGADVNDVNTVGWTALHIAAQMGHLHLVDYLLSNGSEINKGNVHDITPLHVAAFMGHSDITDLLTTRGADINRGTIDKGSTALHFGTQNGLLDVINSLLSHGADVTRADNDGWTALHIAAQNGHLDVTKCLLQNHADVNKGTNKALTALHLAAENGHVDVTKWLLKDGAKVNEAKPDGRTALHLAAEQGDIDIVKVLLEEGALVDVTGANGQTPLHLSSKKGSANSSDILVKHAKIIGILDHRDDEGLTAIHLATQNGHTQIVESLVSHGAALNIQSHDGKTCLHEAIKLSDHTNIKEQTKARPQQISEDFYQHELSPEKTLVLYLIEHGAKLDIRDGEGKLPIHYATKEAIRQMIFSSLPSIEMIRRCRAEEAIPLVTVSVDVDNGGKQIDLKDVGISMYIPSGAVSESGSCEITLTSIQDPPNIISQGGESLACLGIRCDPPNMIFHHPVKIRIPHSAVIINPDQVKPDIVCRVWDSAKDLPRTSRNRSSSSPNKTPYCRMYRRHLELYIGYCAEWWVLIPLEQQVIRHRLMCTPYIPDKIERGKEFEVHLHMHADLTGIETKKQQSYHKSHCAVPFSVESKSGDVTVTSHRDGEQVESKVLSSTDACSKMRHNILLSVTPTEDDVEFTITITQAGRLGMSRSIAFIIRHTDGPEYQLSSRPPSFVRVVEEVSKSDQPDIDVLAIAQTMTVDQFYDLGVALGFTIQQLDVIEYRRFRDREQAIYDMLVIWRKGQASGLAAKETLLSLMESLESPAEETAISDIGLTGDISDRTLLAFARQIRPKKFYEIGEKLGLNKSELEHIEHRTLYNRNDANIQMLSSWKASQTSGQKTKQTLKLVWESVQDASKAEKTKDENEEEEEDEEVAVRELEVNSTTPPEQIIEQSESEDMEIINTISDSDGDESGEDIDLRGGPPSTDELCSVALPMESLSSVWELGKALRLDDDVIVGFVALSDSEAMSRLAQQILNKWYRRLGSQENEMLMTNLLQDYNIQDCNSGVDEISKRICTTQDLLDLSERLDLTATEILQIMSTSVSFPPTPIQHIVLQMLNKWVQHGGTRQRLLEIAQAFHFNDAADKVATAMEHHPGFLDPLSHGIIDHDGGELKLDKMGIRLSIPAGAIPKGMRSVVTLSVPSRCSSKIPLQDGDVLITPVIECSFTEELLIPATVALPHCIQLEQHQDDLHVSLYTMLEPGKFGYRSLLSNTSRDFHMSKDMIDFPMRHLQLWALSSSNLYGVQFTCDVFHPRSILPSQKPTLRICIAHPCNSYRADMCRRLSLSEPFYQLATEIKFSLESKDDDLRLVCLSDSEQVQETAVPVRCLLNGEGNTLNFELLSSHAELGAKKNYLRIEQGTSTLAEREIPISIEVEPDKQVNCCCC